MQLRPRSPTSAPEGSPNSNITKKKSSSMQDAETGIPSSPSLEGVTKPLSLHFRSRRQSSSGKVSRDRKALAIVACLALFIGYFVHCIICHHSKDHAVSFPFEHVFVPGATFPRTSEYIHTSSPLSGKKSVSEGGRSSPSRVKMHVVFSTDCSDYHHWQSYMLFYSAMRVGQPGHVTRIASGCGDHKEMQRVRKWHDANIRNVMSRRFHIHFTPKFSGRTSPMTGKRVGEYVYMNKPHGLRHWMEHGSAIEIDEKTHRVKNDNIAIVLLDPDMVLLRPLGVSFEYRTKVLSPSPDEKATRNGKGRGGESHSDKGEQQHSKKKPGDSNSNSNSRGNTNHNNSHRNYETHIVSVQKGKPLAQRYGYGDNWQKYNMTYITGKSNSAAERTSPVAAKRDFPVGPPYIAAAQDMYEIAKSWSDFVTKTVEVDEGEDIFSEMYAYSIAAAHKHLPHVVLRNLMVSSTQAASSQEGWAYVDEIPSGEVCDYVATSATMKAIAAASGVEPSSKQYPLPTVLHYNQGYKVGPSAFTKYRVPHDFFSCPSPLLALPPDDIGSDSKYRYRMRETGEEGSTSTTMEELSYKRTKREIFMVCGMTAALNEASEFFKRNQCRDGHGDTRWDKSVNITRMPIDF